MVTDARGHHKLGFDPGANHRAGAEMSSSAFTARPTTPCRSRAAAPHPATDQCVAQTDTSSMCLHAERGADLDGGCVLG